VGWRGTAVLAVLVVAAGAYVWLDRGAQLDPHGLEFGAGAPRAPTKPVRHLLEFKAEDVVVVRLEHHGQMFQAERDGERWRGATAPSAIKDLLESLGELGVLVDIPAGPADLKEFGLQSPERVLQLQLRGGAKPLVLEIGDRNPATTGVYARLGKDGPVVLAGALAEWEFDKAFKALSNTPVVD
jgi:hypothetical protein